MTDTLKGKGWADHMTASQNVCISDMTDTLKGKEWCWVKILLILYALNQGCATCGPRATTRPAKPFSAALACSTARLNQVQICCWDNHRRGPKRKSRQPRTLLVRGFLSSRSKRFMFNIHEEFVTLGLYSYRSTGD